MRTAGNVVLTIGLFFSLSSCGDGILGGPEGIRTGDRHSDIPEDPGGEPPLTKANNLKPSFRITRSTADPKRIRLNLAGVLDPHTKKPVEFVANETVFVTEDGRLQGIKVSQSQQSNSLPFDIVFVVDNSGSMAEEADAIADAIIEFSDVLSQSGLNIRLGVVGYNGLVRGAVDLTNPQAIKDYLNRKDEAIVRRGTARTIGYEGGSKKKLAEAAEALNTDTQISSDDENTVVAVQYALHTFKWRANAQRIFINFTDEPVFEKEELIRQKRKGWNGLKDFTVKEFCQSASAQQGVIHTVWSGMVNGPVSSYGGEDPGDLSTCTGGTVMKVKTDASDLDLTTIDSTTALANSALVEFLSDNDNSNHEVTVTIKQSDDVDGVTEISLSYKFEEADRAAEPTGEDSDKRAGKKDTETKNSGHEGA